MDVSLDSVGVAVAVVVVVVGAGGGVGVGAVVVSSVDVGVASAVGAGVADVGGGGIKTRTVVAGGTALRVAGVDVVFVALRAGRACGAAGVAPQPTRTFEIASRSADVTQSPYFALTPT